MDFSSFLKPSSRPKSLRSSEAERKARATSDVTSFTDERRASIKRATTPSATAKSPTSNATSPEAKTARSGSGKTKRCVTPSTLYNTTAASRARQRAAAESLSKGGTASGKLGLTTSGRSLTSSGQGHRLTSGRSVGELNTTKERRKVERRASVTSPSRRSGASTPQPRPMTSAIDRKSAKVEKPHPYRVKTRVTSEENLSRNKTSKENAASDETPKKTKAAAAKKEAAEPAAAAATSTKTKTKEAKKKSRDAKSLTKRVAKILTGSSRSQAEARPSHDDVSSASAQTSSANDASVTSREGDDVTEVYFLIKGRAGFVLPKYKNAMYIEILMGSHFGVIDILGSILHNQL